MLTNYIVLAIYFGILFLIGILSSKKIESASDFFVGGKKLGYWVVAFSARATGESGWLLLGLTGMGALLGLKSLWVVAGEVIGVSLCWFLMAKPFKNQSDAFQSLTIPDYLVSRFKSKNHTLRIVAATVLTVFITIYISAQIDATGAAFETFFGINYFVGALLGFGIVVFYILFGGFVAVAWSDLFQGIMMLLGLVALPITAYFSLNSFGKSQSLFTGLKAIDPSLISIWGEGGFSLFNLMGIIGFLMIGIGFLGSPQIFVRFMSIRNEDEINKGRWVAIAFTILTDTAAVFAGMIGRYLLSSKTDSAIEIFGNGAQNVLPLLVETIMPSIFIAIYIAVILSAIMSTIDSLLVVSSSALTRDIYQQIINPKISTKKMTSLSRNTTLILAIFALIISFAVAAISPTRTVFWFVIFGWSGISACFCPMMILSLFWKNYNEKGAIASMISGFASVPFFKFIAPSFAILGPYFEQLSELPPSFMVSLLCGIIVSKLTKDKKNSDSEYTFNTVIDNSVVNNKKLVNSK